MTDWLYGFLAGLAFSIGDFGLYSFTLLVSLSTPAHIFREVPHNTSSSSCSFQECNFDSEIVITLESKIKTNNVTYLFPILYFCTPWKYEKTVTSSHAFRGPLLHKKWSFSLRISSANVTKSAVNCSVFIFTEETLDGKLHFLCSAWGLQLYWKKTATQVFCCKYCEMLWTASFIKHLWWLYFDFYFLMLTCKSSQLRPNCCSKIKGPKMFEISFIWKT